MIIIIDGLNKDQHRATLDEVYKLRARVFGTRLNWEVSIEDGKETDHFDHLDPSYVVSVDEEERVLGSMRYLQTTGPNMLSDVFHSLLEGDPPPRSSSLWEASRFCADMDRLDRRRGPRSVSYVTSEIMIGALEYGLQAGIEDVVAVVDPLMNRILKRSGCAPYDYLHSQKSMGKAKALAALIDCSEERIAEIRATAGVTHDVFASERALSAKSTQTVNNASKTYCEPETGRCEANTDCETDELIESLPDPYLRSYFQEQFRAASSMQARRDTLALLIGLRRQFEKLSAQH